MHVSSIIMNKNTPIRSLVNGRTAYYDKLSNTLVIHDPNHVDLGTVFRPITGENYFITTLK